jgi:hypothetical protein
VRELQEPRWALALALSKPGMELRVTSYHKISGEPDERPRRIVDLAECCTFFETFTLVPYLRVKQHVAPCRQIDANNNVFSRQTLMGKKTKMQQLSVP